jgi:hypothetical protein
MVLDSINHEGTGDFAVKKLDLKLNQRLRLA